MKYISVEKFLMGRAKVEELTPEQMGNMNTIVPVVNMLLARFGEYREVTSGYRTPAVNAATPGAAPRSKHMICAAVDLEDGDGRLTAFCKANLDLLTELSLWCEERQGNWLHLQCIPPASGRRFFKP